MDLGTRSFRVKPSSTAGRKVKIPKGSEGAQASTGQAKIGVIQGVEKLRAKLKIHALSDLEISVKPKIQRLISRASKSIASQVSECADGCGSEARGVEPLQSGFST